MKNSKSNLTTIILLGILLILPISLIQLATSDTPEEPIGLDTIEDLRLSNNKTGKDLAYKSYNYSKKELLIEDKDNKITLQMSLTSPHTTKIGQGNDIKVAEFYLKVWKEGNNLFDSISFYDIEKGYSKKVKDYWFKYGVDYIEEECHNLSELT